MKTRVQTSIVCIAVAAAFASSDVCQAESAAPDFTVEVDSSAARSLVLSIGQSVRLHVSSTVEKLVKEPEKGSGTPRFQWVKNNDLIPEQTNNDFSIPSVSFSDVGSYSVWVNGPKGRQESALVHLSIYSLFVSNSNGGCLGVPVGDFTGGNNNVCGGTGFDRYKVYFPFYGPNARNQTGPFVNSSSSGNLDVTTCTNINGTIDSAVRIQENWLPMTVKDCNDDDASCAAYSKLSTARATNLSTSSSGNNTYRTTIYFKSATLDTNTSVTFRWYYHN